MDFVGDSVVIVEVAVVGGDRGHATDRGRGSVRFGQRFEPSRTGEVSSHAEAAHEQSTGRCMFYRAHQLSNCAWCLVTEHPPRQPCNVLLSSELNLKCGCTVPVIAETCNVAQKTRIAMPVV